MRFSLVLVLFLSIPSFGSSLTIDYQSEAIDKSGVLNKDEVGFWLDCNKKKVRLVSSASLEEKPLTKALNKKVTLHGFAGKGDNKEDYFLPIKMK